MRMVFPDCVAKNRDAIRVELCILDGQELKFIRKRRMKSLENCVVDGEGPGPGGELIVVVDQEVSFGWASSDPLRPLCRAQALNG